MAFKKFITASVLTAALVSVSTVPAFAEELENTGKENLIYDANKNLKSEEIYDRFEQINSTYELYEPFTMEDTEFVENYANNKVDESSQSVVIQPRGMGLFKSSYTERFDDKAGNGGKVKFWGSITSNINLLNHSYGGSVWTSFASGHNASKAKISITNAAYGVLGGNGIGVVYDGSIDASTKDFSQNFSVSEMEDYAAVGVVYTYTNAKVVITTKTGSTYSIRAFD